LDPLPLCPTAVNDKVLNWLCESDREKGDVAASGGSYPPHSDGAVAVCDEASVGETRLRSRGSHQGSGYPLSAAGGPSREEEEVQSSLDEFDSVSVAGGRFQPRNTAPSRAYHQARGQDRRPGPPRSRVAGMRSRPAVSQACIKMTGWVEEDVELACDAEGREARRRWAKRLGVFNLWNNDDQVDSSHRGRGREARLEGPLNLEEFVKFNEYKSTAFNYGPVDVMEGRNQLHVSNALFYIIHISIRYY